MLRIGRSGWDAAISAESAVKPSASAHRSVRLLYPVPSISGTTASKRVPQGKKPASPRKKPFAVSSIC